MESTTIDKLSTELRNLRSELDQMKRKREEVTKKKHDLMVEEKNLSSSIAIIHLKLEEKQKKLKELRKKAEDTARIKLTVDLSISNLLAEAAANCNSQITSQRNNLNHEVSQPQSISRNPFSQPIPPNSANIRIPFLEPPPNVCNFQVMQGIMPNLNTMPPSYNQSQNLATLANNWRMLNPMTYSQNVDHHGVRFQLQQRAPLMNKALQQADTSNKTTPSPLKEVRFQQLPLLYSEIKTIIRPAFFEDGKNFRYKLNANLFQDFKKKGYEILLRICIYKKNKDFQSDRMARGVNITVNNVAVSLNRNLTKAIKSPINLTSFLDAQHNIIDILFADNNHEYASAIFAAKRRPVGEIINLLQTTDHTRLENESLTLIKKKFSSSSEIKSESIKVPLTCSLTKRPIITPIIGMKCEHIACFDAQMFLEMYNNKDEWICPVCNKPIGSSELISDALILRIIKEVSSKCTQVEFLEDGTYRSVDDKRSNEKLISLANNNCRNNNHEIVCIDLSDEEDVDIEEPQIERINLNDNLECEELNGGTKRKKSAPTSRRKSRRLKRSPSLDN